MNPLLAHHLYQLALHQEETLLAEAAHARLRRLARPPAHAFLTLHPLRTRLAAALYAFATWLDDTAAPKPHRPLDILTA